MANDPSARGSDKNAFVGSVTLGGKEVDSNDVIDISISSELDTPDSFTVHLGSTIKTRDIVNNLKLTDPVEVTTLHAGDKEDDIAFRGEVTGIEHLRASSGDTREHLLVHGLNGLHSLSRGKRSCAYSHLPDGLITDQDILNQVVARYPGIINKDVDYGNGKKPPSIEYKHVYQHNQTDLEFLRLRAARIGYYLLVRDKKLLFQERTSTISPLKLVLNRQRTTDESSDNGQKVIALDKFAPRLSTANQFSQVRVRAFKPAERVEMVRTYPKNGDVALFGSGKTGTSVTQEKHKDAPVVRVDIPFDTEAEGDALAKSIGVDRMLNYITGEGSIPGDPRLKAGLVVTINTSEMCMQNGYEVDGKYFITHIRHWYRSKSSQPYTTDFRAQRDATDDK